MAAAALVIAADLVEDLGARKIYKPKPSSLDSGFSCYYHLPIEDSGFAFTVTGTKSPGQQGQRVTWPEACAETKAYLGAIADKLLAFPARTTTPSGKVLIGKDPCATQQQAIVEMNGWTPGSVGRYSPYSCKIKFSKDGDPYTYTLDVGFEYNVEQTIGGFGGSVAANIGGLSGSRTNTSPFPNVPAGCKLSLNYRASEPKGTNTGHLISVDLDPKAVRYSTGQPQSIQVCQVVDKIATAVVQAAG